MSEKYIGPFNNVDLNKGLQKGGVFLFERVRQGKTGLVIGSEEWIDFCEDYLNSVKEQGERDER